MIPASHLRSVISDIREARISRCGILAGLCWHPKLTVLAAAILAIESLVFIGVHVKYREITPIIMSAVLGLLMEFIAYGRMVLNPIV